MRLALASCALLACVLALGCGGVSAADLFLVSRTGAGPHARLTMLVNEEGGVSCNGGSTLKLEDSQLIKADAIKEELEKPASSGLSLAPRPGSVLSYSVRSEHGTVSFSDNSASQPKVLRELALFVLQTAQQVCHLPE
jgi:hypothetical protein